MIVFPHRRLFCGEGQKVMFITMAVNRVNLFQVKITGMSVRL